MSKRTRLLATDRPALLLGTSRPLLQRILASLQMQPSWVLRLCKTLRFAAYIWHVGIASASVAEHACLEVRTYTIWNESHPEPNGVAAPVGRIASLGVDLA